MSKTSSRSKLDTLLAAGKYDYKYINSDCQMPEAESRPGRFTVVHEKDEITNQELLDKYGSRLATIQEVLEYGAKDWDGQGRIASIERDSSGQLWCVCLDRDGSGRCVGVDQGSLDDDWGAGVGFLVREDLAAGALGSSGLSDSWPLDNLEINGVQYRRVK